MAKRLSLFVAAAALVLVAAVAASAAPEVTVGGSKAAIGTPFTGKSTNTIVKTSIGNLTCATVEGTGEITSNTGSTVAGGGGGSLKTATCFFKGTTPITIDDATGLSAHTSEVGKGKVGLTFEATLPELTCHYSGSAVPVTYTSGGSSVVVKGALTAKPAACGTASIEGTYSITSSKGFVVIH